MVTPPSFSFQSFRGGELLEVMEVEVMRVEVEVMRVEVEVMEVEVWKN